jgi:hypothetical protein
LFHPLALSLGAAMQGKFAAYFCAQITLFCKTGTDREHSGNQNRYAMG